MGLFQCHWPLYYGSLFVLAGIVLYFFHSRQSSSKRLSQSHSFSERWVLLAIIFVINHLLLLYKWNGMDYIFNDLEVFALGRFLPISDGAGYFNYAQYLELTGRLIEFPMFTRSLASQFYAFVFSLNGHDTYGLFVILNALASISIWVAARPLIEHGGKIQGTAFAFALMLAGTSYSGLMTTELMGFICGNLSFAFLARGLWMRRFACVLMGMAWLGLSFAFRPGAVLVFPVLLIFLVFYFGSAFRQKLIHGALITFCFLLCFNINSLTNRILSPDLGVPQGNFAYVLYGLSQGGESWIKIFDVFPEMKEDYRPEYSAKAYRAAFESIRNHPGLLVKGMVKHWGYFLRYSDRAAIKGINTGLPGMSRMLYYFSFLILILSFFKTHRKDPVSSYILLSVLGIFLSFPFIRLPDDGISYRILASSSPVFAYLLVYGLSLLPTSTGRKSSNLTKANRQDWIFASFLFLVIVLPALFLKFPRLNNINGPSSYFEDATGCKDQRYIAISKGNILKVGDCHLFGESRFCISPDLYSSSSVINKWQHDSIYVARGYALLATTDLEKGDGLFLRLSPADLQSIKAGIARVCIDSIESNRYTQLVTGEIEEIIEWHRLD